MKTLETERLILRPFTLDDAPFMLRALNEPSFHEFIGDRGVRTVGAAREYLEERVMAGYPKGLGMFLVLVKSEDEENVPAGMCGFVDRESLDHVDLGFSFVPEFWRRGFAFESSQAVLAYGQQELGIARVLAIVDPTNRASVSLLEKLGFELEKMIQLSGDDIELKLFGIDLDTET